jgi:hypothetical protein
LGGKKIAGVERIFDTKVFDGNVWGLEWFNNDSKGLFPQYFKHVGEERVAVAAADVPAETQLLTQKFKMARRGEPYTSPTTGAWSRPGPKRGPFTVKLGGGLRPHRHAPISALKYARRRNPPRDWILHGHRSAGKAGASLPARPCDRSTRFARSLRFFRRRNSINGPVPDSGTHLLAHVTLHYPLGNREACSSGLGQQHIQMLQTKAGP